MFLKFEMQLWLRRWVRQCCRATLMLQRWIHYHQKANMLHLSPLFHVQFFEQCAVYTSSIYNFFPINQLNSKELLYHLKYILKNQFVLWISVKENSSFNIEFIDIHDANFAYAMIQCSLWSRKYRAFAACSCLCVEGKLADHACILFMLQEYNDLRQKSEEYMHNQAILTAVHWTGEYTDSHYCD